jgi:8-oxo-dGTP pyrophosphatase MutT (NUDIX family)
MSEKVGYRNSAKAIIRVKGAILVLHPSGIDANRNWHIPGGIQDDPDEKLSDTAIREVQEETMIDLSQVNGDEVKVSQWTAVDRRDKVLITATFFLYDLDKKPKVFLSDEHDDYAWLTKEDAKDYPANKEVYEIAEELL